MATYVLIHGAYQGGWIWKRVAERLRAAGHTVHAPTLDGCAERHDGVRAGITNRKAWINAIASRDAASMNPITTALPHR